MDNVVLSKNGLIVTIATIPTDEENITKTLQLIPIPKAMGTQSTNPADPDYGPNDTQILDILNQVEQRITIDGYLATGLGDSDTSNTASGKKVDLKNIILGGGIIDMTYEGSTFSVGIDKLSIKREQTNGLTDIDSVGEFTVKFTAIRGVDIV